MSHSHKSDKKKLAIPHLEKAKAELLIAHKFSYGKGQELIEAVLIINKYLNENKDD